MNRPSLDRESLDRESWTSTTQKLAYFLRNLQNSRANNSRTFNIKNEKF